LAASGKVVQSGCKMLPSIFHSNSNGDGNLGFNSIDLPTQNNLDIQLALYAVLEHRVSGVAPLNFSFIL